MPGSNLVVAIDGPAGSGKSTLARSMSRALGLPYVNTGLMYRALTLAAQRAGVSASDEVGLLELLSRMSFDLSHDRDPDVLVIDGGIPGPELDSAEVEAAVSEVARHAAVREEMRARQRTLGEAGAVMEGRDIASAVFPDADLKIYLEASPDVRAERRASERSRDDAATAEALHGRDSLDSRVNAFEPADGAVLIDTTGLSADEVLALALALAKETTEDDG
jgi:cytidylate kinase